MAHIFVFWSALAVIAAQVSIMAQAAPALEDESCSLDIDGSAHTGDHNCAALLQKRKHMLEQDEDIEEKSTVDVPHKKRMSAITKKTVKQSSDSDAALGESAALSEKGYLEVAETKDAQQMESFMLRLIGTMGLHVQEKGGLRGVIPYYDGTKSVQSFKALQAEIKKASRKKDGWVTSQGTSQSSVLQKGAGHVTEASGSSAQLDEAGYYRVALLQSNREMAKFVRRLVTDLGLCIYDEGALLGVAPYYSGEKDTQSFGHLRAEVLRASKKEKGWAAPCRGKLAHKSTSTSIALTGNAVQKVKKTTSEEEAEKDEPAEGEQNSVSASRPLTTDKNEDKEDDVKEERESEKESEDVVEDGSAKGKNPKKAEEQEETLDDKKEAADEDAKESSDEDKDEASDSKDADGDLAVNPKESAEGRSSAKESADEDKDESSGSKTKALKPAKAKSGKEEAPEDEQEAADKDVEEKPDKKKAKALKRDKAEESEDKAEDSAESQESSEEDKDESSESKDKKESADEDKEESSGEEMLEKKGEEMLAKKALLEKTKALKPAKAKSGKEKTAKKKVPVAEVEKKKSIGAKKKVTKGKTQASTKKHL